MKKDAVTIPARYRELLENGAYVTQGFDRNLMVLDAPSFEKMYDACKPDEHDRSDGPPAQTFYFLLC